MNHPVPPHRRSLSTAIGTPSWLRAGLLALSLGAGLAAPPSALAQGAQALAADHAARREQLARSPFGRPLLLEGSADADRPSGDVYAVLDHPFATVAGTLRQPAAWCDVLMLQHNVKQCHARGDALQVAIGRKHDQPVEDALQVAFRYAVQAATDAHLAVRLDAAEGPLGTRNYRLGFEAVPLDARRTFVRMSYAYTTGTAARMATDLYLATSGRNKIGFTVTGRDAAGQPVHVRGVQGIAERNTMRYFLAIEALLGSLSAPPEQRADKRLRDWFAATERHPRQLREMDEAEYLAMKRKELQVVAAARKERDADS